MTPKNEEIQYLVAPPEIWGKKTELKDTEGETIQFGIEKGLAGLCQMNKAYNARVPGWLKMKEYLAPAGDGKPWWQISPCCVNLIRTIPSAIYSDKPGKSEDLDTRCEDHALDDCRYGLNSLGEIPKDNSHPLDSGYEKIFGSKRTYLEVTTGPISQGRGGYG